MPLPFVTPTCHFYQFRQLAEVCYGSGVCKGHIEGEGVMRIMIDLNRCLGYAQCVPLAPTVLKLSGEEALMYNPNPDDSLRQQVLRAAASCPVQAISVDELHDSECMTKS